MTFEELSAEFEKLSNQMLALCYDANGRQRGYKSAHKDLRKVSVELSKLLPDLRKQSIVAEKE